MDDLLIPIRSKNTYNIFMSKSRIYSHLQINVIFWIGVVVTTVLLSAFYFIYFIPKKGSPLTTNLELSPQQTQPLASPISYPCTGNIFVNDELGYEITCPQGLTIYTYQDEYNPYMKKQESMIFLCEQPITQDTSHGYYLCPAGGIMIWANGDGWGGGGRELETMMLDGKKHSFALYPTGFGQLYTGDVYSENNGNRFLIQGSFSSTFTKSDAFKVLASFQTIKK